MAKGLESLDAHIRRLQKLPGLVRAVAPEVAETVEAELLGTIARGTTAEGEAWKPRQDGAQPLRTAGNSLAVGALGTKVFARLRGHVARHHKGIAKGGLERPILPTNGIPPKMSEAIRKVVLRRFELEVARD